jgi:hypothetical protein
VEARRPPPERRASTYPEEEMTEPRTLKLAIALDPDFARTMTDEEAQQLGVLLKDRARMELGLDRTAEMEAELQARLAAEAAK